MTDKTIEDLAAETKAAVDRKFDEVKAIADEALGKVAAGEQLSEDTKAKADEALTGFNELKALLTDLEQKYARIGEKQTPARAKSLGEQFTESESFTKFKAAGGPRSGKAEMHYEGQIAPLFVDTIKATLTSLATDAAGSVGDAVFPTVQPGVQAMAQRRLTVRSLIAPGRMDGNAIEYVQETGFTNSADMVAEGAAKPGSDLKFEIRTTSAKVIAHWMKASRQVLDDVSQLRSIIDQRLRYGLAYKEEAQLLNGDGTGQNLSGLITNATAYVAPFDPAGAETNIDMIRLAMLQATLAEYPASGIVMHPSDWARIELLKDTAGGYLISNPQGSINKTLWTLPVVDTQAMTVDKFLVGAFDMAAQIFDRWDARVETGYENDDFTKNLITILCEERLALAVYRPEALIYGDFGNV